MYNKTISVKIWYLKLKEKVIFSDLPLWGSPMICGCIHCLQSNISQPRRQSHCILDHVEEKPKQDGEKKKQQPSLVIEKRKKNRQ